MEGAGTSVSAISQTRARRKAADGGHRRDRQGTGGLRLGYRQTGTADRRLIPREKLHTKARRSPFKKTHPKLGKAGGTVTARRTLVSTTSRISSDAGC